MYEIYLESSAEKDLRKVPAALFKTIISKIRALAENPYPNGSRKIKDSNKFWRIRVRHYRVIYEIDDSSKSIKIYKVKHRKEAYR